MMSTRLTSITVFSRSDDSLKLRKPKKRMMRLSDLPPLPVGFDRAFIEKQLAMIEFNYSSSAEEEEDDSELQIFPELLDIPPPPHTEPPIEEQKEEPKKE